MLGLVGREFFRAFNVAGVMSFGATYIVTDAVISIKFLCEVLDEKKCHAVSMAASAPHFCALTNDSVNDTLAKKDGGKSDMWKNTSHGMDGTVLFGDTPDEELQTLLRLSGY